MQRIASFRTAPTVILVTVALAVGILVAASSVAPRTAATVLFGITATLLLSWTWRLQRTVARALDQVQAAVDSDSATLEDGIAALGDRLATVDYRLSPAHPVSGLPMREALLAQMAADQRGILGAIAFEDFERLTAFDPALGERVFAASVARLRKMVPPTRFLAQVDRGHVGLWFGEQVAEAEARAELDAISYALGEAVIDEDREIVPQVHLRLATFDHAEGLNAGAFLARTLASFALSRGAEAAAGVTVDHAELARDRYGLEQDLRQAITRREMRLEYQPLIDAVQGRVVGAEALLRWTSADRGTVSPTRFVPVMEAMGLASEIGAWVLNTAVRGVADWQAQGLRDLRVAVNVSGLQLERDDLPILVERTLRRHRVLPAALEIELTESVATNDADHCRRIFQQLRSMGVKLAVDDFGTGYSGFSSLRALAFDKIKIDREFVTGIDSRRDSQAICQSILALGRGLGIKVLAEGVERQAEYAWLRRHGCQHFQGYYFSRPLDPERFAGFVRDTRSLGALLSLGDGVQAQGEKVSA